MRLTLVCPSAYPVLAPGSIPFAGGAEFQMLMLGRAMLSRGHEVHWVVADHGQPEICEVDGFVVHRAFELGRGNRRLRFVPDMWALRRAMRRARGDVVNQRSTSFYTGQCCAFAHEMGAAFVFSLGIDYNCHPDLLGRGPWLIQRLYAYGIRNAEGVLAQTEQQRALMRSNFGVDAPLLPNFLQMPPRRAAAVHGDYVLWVGSMARRKQPELFVELARRSPGIPFRMVGGAGEDRGYDAHIQELARAVPNLEFSGFVRPDHMDAVYGGARLYVNTSRLEGLPNAFLQAWSHELPTLTLGVDPDGVISERGLGASCADLEQLGVEVERYWHDDAAWNEASRRAREHVARQHDVTQIAPVAERHLQAAIRRRRGEADHD